MWDWRCWDGELEQTYPGELRVAGLAQASESQSHQSFGTPPGRRPEFHQSLVSDRSDSVQVEPL